MRYPGGKGKTFQHLINLMPPHDTYIESHLGGGSVLRHKKPGIRNIGIELSDRVLAQWHIDPTQNVELVHGRAEDFLQSFQYRGTELVYCDPPYPQSTRRKRKLYEHDYSDADHEKLLNILLALPCNVMISSYPNPLYDQKLIHWNKRTFSAMSHTGLRLEAVWFNYATPTRLHDTRYIGDSFRLRQSAKRRMLRLQNKLAEMDPVERFALAEWLDNNYPRSLEPR